MQVLHDCWQHAPTTRSLVHVLTGCVLSGPWLPVELPDGSAAAVFIGRPLQFDGARGARTAWATAIRLLDGAHLRVCINYEARAEQVEGITFEGAEVVSVEGVEAVG